MSADNSYAAVMDRLPQIIRNATGIDYAAYETGGLAFDYERMMASVGYSLEDIIRIQRSVGVGHTPLLELKNINALIRKIAPGGLGARIFIKDEQCNPSGSFKDRRAAMSAHQARKMGFRGLAAATSGNYGAAVASQAAMLNLKCIIVQECFDSRKVGQPEILEKQRKCECLGAEVIQLTVGPELFYSFLRILEETVDRAVQLDAEGDYMAHLYAMFLLAQFRETRAYPLVVRFASLPGDLLDSLCGDFITEDLGQVLASVCGGDLAGIQTLIENEATDQWVRGAALRQEPTGRSTTLAHQIQNFFPGETRIDARHVQR